MNLQVNPDPAKWSGSGWIRMRNTAIITPIVWPVLAEDHDPGVLVLLLEGLEVLQHHRDQFLHFGVTGCGHRLNQSINQLCFMLELHCLLPEVNFFIWVHSHEKINLSSYNLSFYEGYWKRSNSSNNHLQWFITTKVYNAFSLHSKYCILYLGRGHPITWWQAGPG